MIQNTIPIQSLLLPNLKFANRKEFLYLRKQFVIEPALQHYEYFRKNGGNASHFHKHSKDVGFGVPLIHTLDYNNMFCLRAYGEQAVKTLEIWQQWIAGLYPHTTKSAVSMSENYSLEKLEESLYYISYNYIPFNNCLKAGNYFVDADRTVQDEENILQKRLIGNLRTFLTNIGLNDRGMDTVFQLLRYPDQSVSYAALLKESMIYKSALQVIVKTNLSLPLLFSLGQNVGYGCGLFEKVMEKSQNQVRNINIF